MVPGVHIVYSCTAVLVAPSHNRDRRACHTKLEHPKKPLRHSAPRSPRTTHRPKPPDSIQHGHVVMLTEFAHIRELRVALAAARG